MQIWGMGIASYDVTGDGYPDVFLTSQGDNKLQTLAAGPDAADLPRHRAQARRERRPPFTGGDIAALDRLAPGVRGRQQRRLHRPLRLQGQRRARMPDYADAGPEQPAPRPARRDVRRGRRAAGIVNFDRGRGAALADFNLDGLLDLVEVEPRRARSRSGGTSAAGDAAKPGADGPLARSAAQPAGPEPGRDRRLDRGQGRRPSSQRRELTVGGGHIGGQLGWVHFGLGPADGAEVRVQWPDGEIGPVAARSRPTSSSIIERGATAAQALAAATADRRRH